MEEAPGSTRPITLSIRLQLLSLVALTTSVVAIGALVIMLFVIGHDGEAVYAQALRSHRLTEQLLGPALLLTGAVLLLIVGIITWLAASQVSFHVAGPLFRLRQNFTALTRGEAIHGIRHNDQLQDLSRQMQDSIAALHSHYQQLEQLAAQAEMQSADSAALGQTLQQIQREAARVRLQ